MGYRRSRHQKLYHRPLLNNDVLGLPFRVDCGRREGRVRGVENGSVALQHDHQVLQLPSDVQVQLVVHDLTDELVLIDFSI